MLREDPLGGSIGEFAFMGKTCPYNVQGTGNPVLIAHGLSAARDSYDWRYIFDCLAGAFLVFALDITGPSDRLIFGRTHYAGMVESFIRQVINRKTSIIASPAEAPFVLLAAFEAPRMVDRVMLAYPDGTVKIRTHGTISRDMVQRKLGIPSIDEVTGGWPWRRVSGGASLHRYATGQVTGNNGATAVFRRSGAPPGGIDPLRFCDEAMRFLG
jgi:pimeloyl-ACP methyl ester carboxylesterase